MANILHGEGYLAIIESLFEIGPNLKLELRYWWLFKIIMEEVT